MPAFANTKAAPAPLKAPRPTTAAKDPTKDPKWVAAADKLFAIQHARETAPVYALGVRTSPTSMTLAAYNGQVPAFSPPPVVAANPMFNMWGFTRVR